MPWARPVDEVLAELATDPTVGLTGERAAARLAANGPNELPAEPTRSLARSVAAQLRETMILVLLGAAALTAATGDLADCAVILLVIAVNTVVGVAQERRAVGAVAALRTLAAPTATVRRHGHECRVDSREVVVGDLLRVAEGDVVAADARLLDAYELEADEALLTGESLPVERYASGRCPGDAAVGDRSTMLHAGTLVVHGVGTAVVVATGVRTELGRIAALLTAHAAPATPLQRRLAALGRRLSVLAAVSCALVVALGLLRGQPWELTVLSGISLAVAAIPESLPAVVALALAGATRRMAALGAVVRSLPAVEALGSVTVLATDKTGTLTAESTTCVALWTPSEGEVSVTDVRLEGAELLAGGAGSRALLEAAVLCNNAEPGAAGTEGALVTVAAAVGVPVHALRGRAPRVHEVPFDSVRREMRTRHRVLGGDLEVVKGAPEVVLPAVGAPVVEVLDRWTAGAYRVLAVSAGTPGRLRLVGLLALADPVRAEARAAVVAARRAGIQVVMITGDHPGTAEAVARATGVLARGEEPGSPDDPLRAVYARTDPDGKLAIITAWREAGHLVAMTGDGVNDAPALRAADVGVAMGRRGTEVAKQAAEVVLTDDSLASVVAAVAEGRRVFDNVRRFVRYGVCGGLAEILVMLLGPFLGLPLPLLPAQILWVNLVTHGLPGVAIGSEQAEPDLLDRPPRPPESGILTRRLTAEVVALGGVVAGCCLGLAIWAQQNGHPWQTMLFATLAVSQLGIALATRSDRDPLWRLSPAGNPFLYVAVASSAGALLGTIYLPGFSGLLGTAPLTTFELLVSLAVSAIPLLAVEAAKSVLRRRAGSPPIPPPAPPSSAAPGATPHPRARGCATAAAVRPAARADRARPRR